MSVTAKINRRAALTAAALAAAGTLAAFSTGPAEAATWGEHNFSTTASAVSDIAVHPNTIILANCGEWYRMDTTVNIRSNAGINNPVIGHGYNGQDFAATIESSYYYSGYRWLYGYDVETGVRGWIAKASWLTDEGPAYCTTTNT